MEVREKKRNKEVRLKAKIAECFKKHFSYFGYKKTSVEEIARELGISKKTIYQYFPGKRNIYNLIVKKIAEVYITSINKRLNNSTSCKEKILKLIPLVFTESVSFLKDKSFETRFKNELASLAFTKAYTLLIERLIIIGIENNEFKLPNQKLSVLFIQAIIIESINLIEMYDPQTIKEETISTVKKILN